MDGVAQTIFFFRGVPDASLNSEYYKPLVTPVWTVYGEGETNILSETKVALFCRKFNELCCSKAEVGTDAFLSLSKI